MSKENKNESNHFNDTIENIKNVLLEDCYDFYHSYFLCFETREFFVFFIAKFLMLEVIGFILLKFHQN